MTTLWRHHLSVLYIVLSSSAQAEDLGQDVYHADTPAGKAYIKLTLRADGAPVIQFKELEP